MNCSVLWAWAEDVSAPWESTDSIHMAIILTNEFLMLYIPDLYDPTVSANWEMCAPSVPIDSCHFIWTVQLVQLGYFCGCSAPDVDTARQAYDKIILIAPIYQIQVVVIFEGWCIQHLVRNLWDLSSLGLGHDHRVLIEPTERRSLWSE